MIKIANIKVRFELKTGKFGYYFFDKDTGKDLTLEMLLNKLNSYERNIMKAHRKNILLRKEIYMLKRDD